MPSKAETPEEYIDQIPIERKEAFEKLIKVIDDNIPQGFSKGISYGMIGYSVPHSTYPQGYHVNPKIPLPFLNLASQKNYFALYHSGIYADETLLEWFVKEYPKHCSTKLDMGKSCIRFKSIGDIPYKLIAELAKKITVKKWIEMYESINQINR